MPNVQDKERRLAVITGASEGIGRDLAACYATAGFDLVLVARRETLLRDVATDLAATRGVRCRVVVADLSTSDGCEQVIQAIAPERHRLYALVNNAGLGTHGWFHELPIDRQRTLIDVNVSALTHLTRGVLPWLRANGAGHVMNVASVASFQPGPLMATYYASKAYVLSLSEALHNECRGTGVTVSAVCPGPTRTGFARVAGISPRAKPGGAPAMDSRVVADLAFRGTMAGRPVILTGFRNRVAAWIGRYLPRTVSAELVRRIQMRRLEAGQG
ncbi:MAG: SDR family oxidoreductase [Gemmatimonadaceae bacterium]|nr:SDR family oxidoreductase [Gemmatimonadaceae bacterium]